MLAEAKPVRTHASTILLAGSTAAWLEEVGLFKFVLEMPGVLIWMFELIEAADHVIIEHIVVQYAYCEGEH